MANNRALTSYRFDPKTKDISRLRMMGDEEIENKVVAKYDPDSQILTFPDLNANRLYKTGVIAFCGENEFAIREFKRGDLPQDQPLSASVPARPKKDRLQGDKTPSVVEWYFRHRFNLFCSRYTVLDRHYSGMVRFKQPHWRARPGDGEQEYVGELTFELRVTDVIVAVRAVCITEIDSRTGCEKRVTFTPEECIDWEEDGEPLRDVDEVAASAGSSDDKGGEE